MKITADQLIVALLLFYFLFTHEFVRFPFSLATAIELVSFSLRLDDFRLAISFIMHQFTILHQRDKVNKFFCDFQENQLLANGSLVMILAE